MDRRLDWTAGEPLLLLSACGRCGNHWYLPHLRCPVCGAQDASDMPSSGTGLCVAVTRLHVTADDQDDPVCLALVELDEGPIVMGRVHDDALAPGDRATTEFRPDGHDGVLVPSFCQEGSPA